MKNIRELDLIDVLNKNVYEDKKPLLGICLGMQLFAEGSEEGQESGFGWINGKVKKFDFKNDPQLKLPHMGWNLIDIKKHSLLFKNLPTEPRYYFVHSYYFECKNPENVLTQTTYGKPFISSVEHDNIFGVQFHPEKSHKFGMKLFKNFSDI